MAGRAALMIVWVLHAFVLALTCQVSIAPASADDTSAEAGRLESGPTHSVRSGFEDVDPRHPQKYGS